MGTGMKFGVFLRTEHIDSVYFDQDHVVFPNKSRKIAANGPFLDIEFTLKGKRKSPADVSIEILDDNQLLAVASHRSDETYLAKVRAVHEAVLRIRAKDGATGTVWEGEVAVPIKGAAPSLVEYFGEIDL
jgi:hypothetical protein